MNNQEKKPRGGSATSIRKALAFRFGPTTITSLTALGNRFADAVSKRFVSIDAVLQLFQTLTPHEARLADRMLSEVCNHFRWPSRWREIYDAISGALDEMKRTAAATKRSVRMMKERASRQRFLEIQEELDAQGDEPAWAT